MDDKNKHSKAYLIECQIMHQIKKQQNRLDELDAMRKKEKPEITETDYWNAFYSCHGAITQLMIVLTCYDNPLSNFLAEEKQNKR